MNKRRKLVCLWLTVIFLVLALITSFRNFVIVTKICRQMESDYAILLDHWKNKCASLEEENAMLRQQLGEVEKEPLYKFTEEEVDMLARCVEAEAGNPKNHSTSQKYITQVILNRVESSKFPNTLKGVIYEKSNNGVVQFSVAYNGVMNRTVQQETLDNVRDVLQNGTDLPKYVCFFYSTSVKGNWVNTLPIYDTVEGTVFAYSSKEVF